MCEQKIREALRKFMKNEDNIDLFTEQIFSIVQDENSTEYNWQNLVYETMCLIEETKSVVSSYNILDQGKIGFKDETFEEFEVKRSEQDHYMISPPQVIEGALECPACGSKKVLSYPLQTRGRDEATSVFAKCVKCKKPFRAN